MDLIKEKTESIRRINRVIDIYNKTLASMDKVLVGQGDVKRVVTASILCDTNSRLLLTGDTGYGKSSLSNFLASSFDAEKISVTSDMIPTDILGQLMRRPEMRFLQIEEFNRASGKVQSTFIELFENKEINVDGQTYRFGDFYVVATQNTEDISGIFTVPQAVQDRFSVAIPFGSLSEDEKRELLFGGFEASKESSISYDDIMFTKTAVDEFNMDKSANLMMEIFNMIDSMTYENKRIFFGSNIRAHKFALKLAKLSALAHGRNYILPMDIADFINYLYMHRVSQKILMKDDFDTESRFEDVKSKVLKLDARKFK